MLGLLRRHLSCNARSLSQHLPSDLCRTWCGVSASLLTLDRLDHHYVASVSPRDQAVDKGCPSFNLPSPTQQTACALRQSEDVINEAIYTSHPRYPVESTAHARGYATIARHRAGKASTPSRAARKLEQRGLAARPGSVPAAAAANAAEAEPSREVATIEASQAQPSSVQVCIRHHAC